MVVVDGIEVNEPGDAQPWGAREQSAIVQLINRTKTLADQIHNPATGVDPIQVSPEQQVSILVGDGLNIAVDGSLEIDADFQSKGTGTLNSSNGTGGWNETAFGYENSGGVASIGDIAGDVLLAIQSEWAYLRGKGSTVRVGSDGVKLTPVSGQIVESSTVIKHPNAISDDQSATLGQVKARDSKGTSTLNSSDGTGGWVESGVIVETAIGGSKLKQSGSSAKIHFTSPRIAIDGELKLNSPATQPDSAVTLGQANALFGATNNSGFAKGEIDGGLSASVVWNSATRTYTLNRIGKFWSYRTYFEIPIGDPKLSCQIPSSAGTYYLGFNNVGQLVYYTAATITYDIRTQWNPLLSCNYDGTDEIVTLFDAHDIGTDSFLREAETDISELEYPKDGGLNLSATQGQSVIAVGSGYLYDVERRIDIDAENAFFPCYYLNGKDSQSQDRLYRKPLNLTDAQPFIVDSDIGLGSTGRVVYNLNTAGTITPAVCPVNDFICAHIFAGNGLFPSNSPKHLTVAIGQARYDSVGNARAGIEAEAQSLVNNPIGKRARILYSLILNHLGVLQYVETTPNVIALDWRNVAGISGGISTSTPNFQQVTDVSATTTNNITIPNATLGEHAINRTTGDDRYIQKFGANPIVNPQSTIGLDGDIGASYGSPFSLTTFIIYDICYLGNGVVLVCTGTTELVTAERGRLYRSEDNGVSWSYIIPHPDYKSIQSICYLGGGVVLLGAGNTSSAGDILRSTDGGKTFSVVDLGGTISAVWIVKSLGNGIVLAGSVGAGSGDGDVYRSTNSGASFAKVEMGSTIDIVYDICYLGNGVVLVGTGGAGGVGDIYRSTDNGATFSKIEMGATIEYVLSICYLGNGVVLVGTGLDSGDGDIYRSTDNGLTFETVEMGGTIPYILAITSLGNNVVVASSLAKVYRSVNGGLSFSEISIGASLIRAICLVEDGAVLVGNDVGALYRSVSTVAESPNSIRVTSSTLTGFSASSGTIVATDTVLQAFQKASGNFTHSFKFERKGGALGAGDYDCPYTSKYYSTDDGTSGDLSASRCGKYVPFPCRITGLDVQFGDMDDTVTVYMRKNGTKTTIGTVTIAEGRRKSFLVDIACSVGDQVFFGFTNAVFGNFSPCITAYIRQQ